MLRTFNPFFKHVCFDSFSLTCRWSGRKKIGCRIYLFAQLRYWVFNGSPQFDYEPLWLLSAACVAFQSSSSDQTPRKISWLLINWLRGKREIEWWIKSKKKDRERQGNRACGLLVPPVCILRLIPLLLYPLHLKQGCLLWAKTLGIAWSCRQKKAHKYASNWVV